MLDSRKYGWRPDVATWYDPYYKLTAPTHLDHVDRIGLGHPIDDQGSLGSCTGNATTAAVEIITGSRDLSRLMVYFNGRVPDALQDVDSGATISNVIAGVLQYGIASEDLWPYDVAKFAQRPSLDAYADGAMFKGKVAQPQRVPTLASLKHALASGYLVVFGFSVPEYFDSDAMRENAWLGLPQPHERMIGGHCVVACGFDDRAARGSPASFVWVRNSWGEQWGDQGYFRMDQRWFIDPRRLCDDMWAILPA